MNAERAPYAATSPGKTPYFLKRSEALAKEEAQKQSGPAKGEPNRLA